MSRPSIREVYLEIIVIVVGYGNGQAPHLRTPWAMPHAIRRITGGPRRTLKRTTSYLLLTSLCVSA